MVHPTLLNRKPAAYDRKTRRRMTTTIRTMKTNPNSVVALGEEEIAQKAAKTGFLEHGFWGQVLVGWIQSRTSANWGQVKCLNFCRF
jgi:hypothetical protein